MKRNFKISDIRKALDFYEQEHLDSQSISFVELEQITKKFRTPPIYHIEELIKLLSDYIADNPLPEFILLLNKFNDFPIFNFKKYKHLYLMQIY